MGSCRNLLILLFIFATFHVNASGLHHSPVPAGEEGNGLVVAPMRRSLATVSDTNTSFALAAERTQRKDPLNGLKYYTGGWNISNEHYWASVGFSAAPIFATAGIWFVAFGIVLLIACCCYCCCPSRSYSYSRAVFVISLVLLIVFTAAAIAGCIILYGGQGKFHRSTTATLDYVVSQSDDTVANLRSFSNYLETAKAAGVGQISLSSDLKSRIDEVVRKVNASSDELAARTSSNSHKIRTALETVRKILIIVAAVMLLLAFVGFVFSMCGLESLVYILVFLGWILVAGTFVMCGTFLLLHNVVADTCVAMDEWVLHPHEHTALDDILPCVDAAATTEALNRSKEVNYQLVSVLNGVVSNISNGNFPPQAKPLYYNQSGPLVPVLCNPYKPDLSNRTCAPGEVGLDNAQQVWQGYVCRTSVVSGSEICTTAGRITPSMYSQLISVVNVSYGLHHYGPILADLADCTFVRQTFQSVSKNYCPGLGQYSDHVFRGLLIVSIAILLSVMLWVVYSRERRKRSDTKKLHVSPYNFPVEEKALLKSPRRPYR